MFVFFVDWCKLFCYYNLSNKRQDLKMTAFVDMVQQFQKEYDKMLKTFNEIDSQVVGDKKFFNFKHKSMPTTARITLTYGSESMINRPSVVDVKTEFFHDNK